MYVMSIFVVLYGRIPSCMRLDLWMGRASGSGTFKRFLPHTSSSNILVRRNYTFSPSRPTASLRPTS